jgi:hypothetical protein
MKQNTKNNTQRDKQVLTKKLYKKPELIPLGDIRDVTMGGSPGFGDSGAAAPEKPF